MINPGMKRFNTIRKRLDPPRRNGPPKKRRKDPRCVNSSDRRITVRIRPTPPSFDSAAARGSDRAVTFEFIDVADDVLDFGSDPYDDEDDNDNELVERVGHLFEGDIRVRRRSWTNAGRLLFPGLFMRTLLPVPTRRLTPKTTPMVPDPRLLPEDAHPPD
ncbi:hypothetical protein BCR42DRAFT_75832 [Absidia repens]|uniref:Uncharacterized protein n=1 Tax=Absidia repens TaxID=90262 RepID=A0A1X2IAF1_9FUNG|nr:hypothetical protein BCR42DRAFT_75832 [Absidia repens]